MADRWDTGRTDHLGKSILRYALAIIPEPVDSRPVVFDGEDFACSPLHAIDSDATAAALVSFFAYDGETMARAGAIEPDDHRGWNERQREAIATHYEALSLWQFELDPDA